jgi:hypothetical protein
MILEWFSCTRENKIYFKVDFPIVDLSKKEKFFVGIECG